MKRARLRPTPWWCDRLPPAASTARWPGVPHRDVRRLDLVGRRGGGEREVQAGAVRGSCATGDSSRCGRAAPAISACAGLGEDRRPTVDHGAAISIVSTTKPLRVSACSALVSLRWASQRVDELVDSGRGRRRTRPRRHRSSRRRGRCRPRRAPAARSACRRRRGCAGVSTSSYRRSTAGVAPRRRIRRHASMPVSKSANAVRGASLVGGDGMGAQPHPGDHAERALAAEEQVREIGAHRRRRAVTGAHHRAVGEHDLEPDDHRRRSCRSACCTDRRRGRPPIRRRWRCRSSAGSGRRSGRSAGAARPRGRARTCRPAPRRRRRRRRRRRCPASQ